MNFNRGREIGRGGFGIVYQGTGDDGNAYALKYLNTAALPDEETVRRFEREVRYQKQVSHPNVVPVIADYLNDKPPWFVMPLASGSLKDDLDVDRTLCGSPKEALFDILSDSKPFTIGTLSQRPEAANVLKYPEADGSIRYAISDFGLTTPNWTDIYFDRIEHGGGTVLYRRRNAQTTFVGLQSKPISIPFGAILHDIFGPGVGRIPHSELTVAGPLGPVVEKCTKSQPRGRYPSIAALREDLFDVLDNTVVQFFSQEEEDVIAILKANDHLTDEQWIAHLI